MVVGAFPIAKLSVLLVKQISKPIANLCKERAKNHPFFRTYVCMPPAQFYNWCEIQTKMWILNMGKPVNIPVLSEAMAIELGANLLGEGIIFALGAGLLIFEYNRQGRKEEAKETQRVSEMSHINRTIEDLYFTVQKQETQLREMERIVLSLTGQPPKHYDEKEPKRRPSDPPKPNPPQANIKSEPVKEIVTFTTPYPERGLVNKALNYIQLDVLTFTVDANNNNKNKLFVTSVDDTREDSVITNALHHIENHLHSLFD